MLAAEHVSIEGRVAGDERALEGSDALHDVLELDASVRFGKYVPESLPITGV